MKLNNLIITALAGFRYFSAVARIMMKTSNTMITNFSFQHPTLLKKYFLKLVIQMWKLVFPLL